MLSSPPNETKSERAGPHVFWFCVRIYKHMYMHMFMRNAPIRDCHPNAKRHLGDSNPCGQSPMDFESISLAARTKCLAQLEHEDTSIIQSHMGPEPGSTRVCNTCPPRHRDYARPQNANSLLLGHATRTPTTAAKRKADDACESHKATLYPNEFATTRSTHDAKMRIHFCMGTQ